MFRGYRHKYKNLTETDSNLNQHLEQSGFPPISIPPFTATSELLVSSWAHLWLCSRPGSTAATLHNGWKLQSDPPRVNYSVELVHICHSHRNNHLHSGNYCISTNKPCSSELPKDWSFEFIMKYLSQDLRSPFAFSLYPEAPQINEDPPLPLLTPNSPSLWPKRAGTGRECHWTSSAQLTLNCTWDNTSFFLPKDFFL